MIKHDDQHLDILVQELSKSSPNTHTVKSKTELLGIPYNQDLIVLMSDVLVYLSKQPRKKSHLKEKNA